MSVKEVLVFKARLGDLERDSCALIDRASLASDNNCVCSSSDRLAV